MSTVSGRCFQEGARVGSRDNLAAHMKPRGGVTEEGMPKVHGCTCAVAAPTHTLSVQYRRADVFRQAAISPEQLRFEKAVFRSIRSSREGYYGLGLR